MGWARGAYANNNNKRARKMSAFMPMRGRKDGRDDARLETTGTDMDGSNPMADTNRGDSDSIHDWITSSTVSPSFWASTSSMDDGGLQAISQQRFLGTPVPIQFANQVAVHRMQQRQQPRISIEQQQQQQQPRPMDSVAMNGASISSSGVQTIMTPAEFASSDLMAGPKATAVMPVKLRRAFHPMRGKKWAGNYNNGLDDDQVDMMMGM